MKTTLKAMSACALAAGLLTVGVSDASATTVSGDLIDNVNAQLTALVTTSKGTVKKVRITTKDLVKAISDDFGNDYSGDRIVYWYGNDDYWLIDKHNNLIEDLSYDDVFELDYSWYFYNYSNNDRRYSETGVINFYFASYGDWEYDYSSIEFDSLYGAYAGGYNESPVINGKYFYSESYTDSLGGEGYDGYLSGDSVPVTGTITENGSSIFKD